MTVDGIVRLAEHPRLYVTSERRDAVADLAGAEPHDMARGIAAQAREYVTDPGFNDLLPAHNAHLLRARKMQTRVLTLIVQWLVSGDERYADAAFAHLQTIGGWEYWSWITMRRGDPRPEAIFDLSYGENSATLALGYDLLYRYMSERQRSEIVTTAVERSLRPLLHVYERGEAWWFKKPDTNWNTVCAGGAGMLALAVYDEADEAPEALQLAEESIVPYMAALEETSGGWPEGIGYWNYGMRYAFMYLLSYENAVGQPHPLLHTAGTRKTLQFPLDFCPHGVPCSFGDSNYWSPLPFHLATAHRLGEASLHSQLKVLDTDVAESSRQSHWPNAAESILLHTDESAAATIESGPHPGAQTEVHVYDGLGWARLSDRWPDPRLYLSMRGGTLDVPHGHHDLLSFYAVVGDECLVENLTPAEYLDTTFGPRRYEIFEMAAQSKNVPLVNGVGITGQSYVAPSVENYGAYAGIRLDATEALGGGRDNEPLARYCGRLFLLFGSRAALVVDRIDLWHEGRVESRLHTRADVSARGDNQAVLVGQHEQMSVSFAANAPFTRTISATSPTTPGDDATALRWCGPQELGSDFWMATLLIPSAAGGSARFEETQEGMDVHVSTGEWTESVRLSSDLRPVTPERTNG